MAPSRRQVLLLGAAVAFASRAGLAEVPRPLKIGVLNDMSSVYSDYQGIGSVVALNRQAYDRETQRGREPVRSPPH